MFGMGKTQGSIPVQANDDAQGQQTLKKAIHCNGVGLHSGRDIRMTLRPAEAGTGIVFRRTDQPADRAEITATHDSVSDTRLNTTLANEQGVSVGTVEHLMSALAGCGVDNLIVDLNGPEVPVMDGSAEPFVFLVERAGLQPQTAARHAIAVKRAVKVEKDGCWASLTPSDGFSVNMDTDYDHPMIGRQSFSLTVSGDSFRKDISRARTFGFVKDVEYLQSNGLALGASLDNAVGLGKSTILNDEGLRYADECVRHKILDCIGDLALAGAPIIGAYHGHKAGHALNNALLHELFSSADNWELVEIGSSVEGTVEEAPSDYPRLAVNG